MAKPTKYDFSGYATKCNVKCSDGRTILKHAFKDNDGKTVPLVWNHNHQDADGVLGHAYLEDRDDGVYAYCSFNETTNGKNAKELVVHGDICALSIYANQLKHSKNKEVLHGNIREVSLVLAGANPGAFIENVVLAHSEDGEEVAEEAKIYNDGALEMFHSEPAPQPQPAPAPSNEELEHKEKEDKTVQEVLDGMSEEEKNVMYFLIGAAVEEERKKKNGGNEQMKHNVFSDIKKDDGTELSHDEFLDIIKEAKAGANNGSLKDTFLAHSISGIENLFPEAQAVNKTPETISRDMTWVERVMAAVKHTPFAKVKGTLMNITADEARAKGYVKGNKKVEEVILALKRETSPQTIYKLQKLDRDDIVDITDFDVVLYVKSEMRMMLNEELARAILIGDGRDPLSNDKIKTDRIRPVWQDDSTYSVTKVLEPVSDDDEEHTKFAKKLIRNVIKARKDYKGSGNPVMFTTEDDLTSMLLIEDVNGRVIYDTIDKLKTALRVSDIITVPVMEGQERVDGNNHFKLHAIVVNLRDYNVGANKGGEVNFFDDFDINYNKYEYLIETRCSGALIKPFSALCFEEKVSF